MNASRRTFLAGGIAAFAASCTRSLPMPPSPTTVPLVYDATGTLMLAAVVAGRSSHRFVLDTGAERSALSAAHARALRLSLRDGGEVEGSAGVVRSKAARALVEVPGLEPLDIDFLVYDLAWQDPLCVGILGAEFLGRAPFALHYREQQLVWRAPRPAVTLPLVLDHRIPRIPVSVGAVELSLRLDTGASLPPGDPAYVNLTQPEARRLGLTGAPLEVWSATGTGGARLDLPVHALPSLRVGTRTLSPAFAIVQPAVGYFARADAVGFLGNAVLDKLDPFLDYRGGVFAVTS